MQMPFKKILKVPIAVLHGGFWLLYLLYEVFLNWLTEDTVHFSAIFAVEALLIAFFYLCLFGFGVAQKKLSVGISYFVVLFAMLFFGGYYFLTRFLPMFGLIITTKSFTLQGYIQAVIASSVRIFALAVLFFLVREFFRKQKENAEILQKQTEYKYAFLRAQINPHFLFNTLNALYSQALPKDTAVAENILKLSEMMRYSLDDIGSENEKVTLREELNYLQKLIDFQKLRFGGNFLVNYRETGAHFDHQILKMSLVSIVENAVKYADVSSFPIKISVESSENSVSFICENRKKKTVSEIPSHQLGMKNLYERLDFYFKKHYSLTIREDEENYSAELQYFY